MSVHDTRKTDKLLFACHGYGRPAVGIIGGGGALPIAFERSEEDYDGFQSLESYACDADEFFSLLFDSTDLLPPVCGKPGNGLWVVEASWDQDAIDDLTEPDDAESWEHLRGALRRPTADELSALARGECPWPGGVLL